MSKHLLFMDAETYYDDEYSLSKISIPHYILDKRFELQMVAVQKDNDKPYIVEGPDFPKFLKDHPPEHFTSVTFNSLFDNSIFYWRYNWLPAKMIDVMGMARALMGHEITSASLANILKVMGFPPKGTTIHNVKGLHANDIKSGGLWQQFKDYALYDVEGMIKIFAALLPSFPEAERRLLDLVLRCAVVPRFQIDRYMLAKHICELEDKKEDLLKATGMTKADLMSNAKFATALEKLGVEIEYKPSVSNPQLQIPAFAKTDDFMAKLVEHEDPEIQALAAARLGHKSTIEETRSRKLLSIASLPWPELPTGNGPLRGTMPIPMGYGKTHTHRLAGEWGMNMQNLPSSRVKGSKLRRALIAPPGHKVITADLGQIEARLSAFFAGESKLLNQFARKEDPYMIMGSYIFDVPITGVKKADADKYPFERFIGKTAVLGLGYGCGVDKFHAMVIRGARAADPPINLDGRWDIGKAKKAVETYRQKYNKLAGCWRILDTAVRLNWATKHMPPATIGPVTITYGRIILPNDMSLCYANPQTKVGVNGYVHTYKYGRYEHKMYGAKMLENIVQALARIVVMNAALRLSCRGYNFVLQAHDELVFIVPDADVDNAKKVIHEEMTRRPSWAPDLPLTADVGVGQSYGEAK